MKKRTQGIAIAVGIVFLLVAGMAIAGTTFKDVIKMENKQAFDKHTKGIVSFNHKKHTTDYKLDCGECHHDKNGKPLALKVGDDVQGCLTCHEKGKADRKASKADKMKYYYNAIHENCQGCHEKVNVEKAGDKRKGPAPVSCTKCHPKAPR